MNKHEAIWQIKQGMVTPMKWEYQEEEYYQVNSDPRELGIGAQWYFNGTGEELSELLTTMSK
jgi:hypothetical protein